LCGCTKRVIKGSLLKNITPKEKREKKSFKIKFNKQRLGA
jgi:hypothetical protein